MIFVHTVARKMAVAEYSDFFVFVKLLLLIGTLGVALQTVFAKQAAAAVTEAQDEHLIASTKAILRLSFLLWLVFLPLLVVMTTRILVWLKIAHPAALWLTGVTVLFSVWTPTFKGLLQGRLYFRELGLLHMLDGAVRLIAMVIVVIFLDGDSVGAMVAVMLGQLSTVVLAAVLTREFWLCSTPERFNWKEWCPPVFPIFIGLGSISMMSAVDILFVKNVFVDPNEKALYQGASLCGFALMQLAVPITTVMFPRIIRSPGLKEKTNIHWLAITVIAGFGAVAAASLTIMPELPLRIIYMSSPKMWEASAFVPWFAWALIPLMLASALVQNQLAQGRSAALIWLVMVVVIYVCTLWVQKPLLLNLPYAAAFKRIVVTFGLANLLFLAVASWFNRTKQY